MVCSTLFGLRDIDNNGVPELILLDLMEASDETFSKCVVYTYIDEEVRLIGSELLRYGLIMLSDNPDFSGLFTTNGSSSCEDMYITINNGEFERVTVAGYYGELGFLAQNEISEALKTEWRKMGGEDTPIMSPQESVTLLDTYKINEENISEIILLSPR